MKRLTPLSVSVHNIRHHAARSAFLALIAAISAFAIFSIQIVVSSLSSGMSSLENRLGADLLVVPSGSRQTEESILLTGTPDKFYLDGDTEEKIDQIEGVQQTTSQFYFTSIQADCCTSAVQLVGYDPDTDFVLTPWIAGKTDGKLKDGEILIGSDITPGASGRIMFFGRVYPVAFRLDRTATGIDQSVYMNMKTMQQLIKDAANQGLSYENAGIEGKQSAVLVRLNPDVNAQQEAARIESSVPGVDVIVSSEMTGRLSASLSSLISVFHSVEIVSLILVLFVLTVIFSITFQQRQKEFAILRILGTPRRTITRIALTESILLSIAGAVCGIGISALIVFPFSRLIGDNLNLPYLDSGPAQDLLTAAAVFVITILIGSTAASLSAGKLRHSEDYFLMKEDV